MTGRESDAIIALISDMAGKVGGIAEATDTLKAEAKALTAGLNALADKIGAIQTAQTEGLRKLASHGERLDRVEGPVREYRALRRNAKLAIAALGVLGTAVLWIAGVLRDVVGTLRVWVAISPTHH